jgi:peptide deformylase
MPAPFKPLLDLEPEQPSQFAKPPDIPSLVYLGDPELARPCPPVAPASITGEAFQRRLATLHWAMIEYRGLGIAAPQIGWRERLFVVAFPPPPGTCLAPVQYWINPEIQESSQAHNWAWEGCLSVPGLRGWVRRPAAVLVRGLDGEGQERKHEFTGWEARIFQHEYDHLDGMLFPYRLRDARHLALVDVLEQRTGWPADWPGPGARDVAWGALVPDP